MTPKQPAQKASTSERPISTPKISAAPRIRGEGFEKAIEAEIASEIA